MSSHPSITIALIGQPNVGKSTVFNMLTGLNQHVGNWPGKTIEFKKGYLNMGDTQIQLVDLPGTYSLTANSEEERIARDFIIHESPDIVIALLNAAALERNLYLVTELLALDVPILIGLNMMDVAIQEGFEIDVNVLQTALGIPVIPLVATKNQGVKELIEAAMDFIKDPSLLNPNHPEMSADCQQAQEKIRQIIENRITPPYKEAWIALKLLEGDQEVLEKVKKRIPQGWSNIQEILLQNEDAILDITGGRYDWIAHMVRASIHHPRPGKIVLTDRLDRFATHPVWGLVLLSAVLGLVFFLTYTIATPIVDLLQREMILPAVTAFTDILQNASPWFSGLVVDGIIGGAGMVLTFLPILVLFFLILGVLEDVGYLARAAYVMDRYMHWMGLHGRSFLLFFLGFGCNVPAVMGTRIIEDQRAKTLTMLLIPLIPCSARLAVVSFITPTFFGQQAALVTWLLVISNLAILMIVGISINRIFYRGQQSPFIMEIPLYHAPNARSIALYVWHNTFSFLKKAGGVIVVFSVMIWAFSWFPNGNIETSFLAWFGQRLTPLGRLMGLDDWRLIVALFSSFFAKENTIATLGVLFSASEGSMALSSRIANAISPAGALAFLVVQMLFIPCIATVAVIKQETASWRFAFHSFFLLLSLSLIAGVGVYQFARLLGWGM